MIYKLHKTLILLLATAPLAHAQPGPFAPPAPEARPAGVIDVLDYFLQSDDKKENWTIGGTDVRPDKDPDGATTRTLILNKWSSPNYYEVYHVTPTDIRLRYEVVREGGKLGKDNWVRRFEEAGPDGQSGAIWTQRFVTPGQDGYLSRFSQDRLVFDEKSRSYVLDPAGSGKQMHTYLTVVRASNRWGRNNQTLFDLSDSIRITSEWQDEGKVVEMYDYARGKGLIAWRWLERISTLPPMEGDKTGTLFKCEEGFVQVIPQADPAFRPTVFRYDPKTGQRDAAVETIRFKSHWKPELGEQWYVVYRDTTREGPLARRTEKVPHDFTLPEWESKPGATIRDLPYKNTTPLPPSQR